VQAGDDRLAQRHDLPLHGDHRPGALLHAVGGGLREVRPGAEHLALRPDHDDLDRVVGVGRREVPDQLGDELAGERVAVVRGVEGDGRDAVGDLEVDQLGVGHGRHRTHPSGRR
jgi:hypothetical protein